MFNIADKSIGFVFLIISILTSCNSGRIYESNRVIENDSWSYSDTLTYGFSIDKLDQSFDLLMHLRHSTEYKYQNLWLGTFTSYPDGTVKRDTFEVQFALNTGEWLGTGSGLKKKRDILMMENFNFPQMGQYEIGIIQFMRDNPLEHVSDIGIELIVSE